MLPGKRVKYTEQVNHTVVVGRPEYSLSGGESRFPVEMTTRIVRISVTDADATDSSSDEEGGSSGSRQRVRKFINEVRIQPCCSDNGNGNVTVNGVAKSGGRVSVLKRKKCSGGKTKNAAKLGKFRGTYDTAEEAAMVYDHAAIQLRGPDALTNFSTPPVKHNKTSSGYNSGEESHSNVTSPKSVLRFVSAADSQADSQAEGESCSIFSQSDDAILIKENDDDYFSDVSIFPRADDLFSDFENPVPVPDLFDEAGLSDNNIFGLVLDSCEDVLIGPDTDLGIRSGPSKWQADDFSQDFGDIFGSDPLVAL
ncbi:UNVERIFIED_CONTAM: Ethylene-responsive transcription factor C [Sesamum angustifolium]|uniref:Ethylene-responsive transcription factor C n=1 Tax=Sesamum angustifolium TaxID=2727405 RepID=A0AAW2J7Y6_9LAMI